MKAKLLKKIRKQYSILYNEKGHYYGDSHCSEKYVLVDIHNQYNVQFSNNKSELIYTMLIWIKQDYPHLGKRKRQNNKTIKVWY